MRRIATTVAAGALLFLAGSGCSTMANLDGCESFGKSAPSRPPVPYGGTAGNLSLVQAGCEHPLQGDDTLAFAAMALVDLPLSVVFDTVTLPWVYLVQYRERTHPSGTYNMGPASSPANAIPWNPPPATTVSIQTGPPSPGSDTPPAEKR